MSIPPCVGRRRRWWRRSRSPGGFPQISRRSLYVPPSRIWMTMNGPCQSVCVLNASASSADRRPRRSSVLRGRCPGFSDRMCAVVDWSVFHPLYCRRGAIALCGNRLPNGQNPPGRSKNNTSCATSEVHGELVLIIECLSSRDHPNCCHCVTIHVRKHSYLLLYAR